MNVKNCIFQTVQDSLYFVIPFIMLNVSSNVLADDYLLGQNQFSDHWEKVSDKELEGLRGGFALANGMVVDFRYEKKVYENGIESFSSYFEVPIDMPLVQSGDLNFSVNLPSSILNSVIQNNLDNQIIRTVNTIGIDISNLKNVNYNVGGVQTFINQISPSFK